MEDHIFQKFKKILPQVESNVLLKNHTTFNIGGPAKYFLVAKEPEEIIKALSLAKKLSVPYFVLGGGSNVLVSDEGFEGLVLKIRNENPKFEIKELKKGVQLTANAGVTFADLVTFSAEQGLSGLGWAGGLPGTFGGAIRGNAGAFGGETKDSIIKVVALDHNLAIREFSNEECSFSYRSSVFKENSWIVLSAVIALTKGDKKTVTEEVQSHINYRKERHPLEYPNAGSIFKNCDLNEFSKELRGKFSHVIKQDPFPVIPTAYLVSEAGLKGKRFGGAQVSEKHPNFIVNIENAKAKDVLDIIDFNKKNVKEKYGIMLEQEVQYLS